MTWLREIIIFFIWLKIFLKRTSRLTILTPKIHFSVDHHSRAKLSYKIWIVNEETKKLGLIIKCSCQVMNQPLPIVRSAPKSLFIRNYEIYVTIKISVKMNHTGAFFETIFKNKKKNVKTNIERCPIIHTYDLNRGNIEVKIRIR